MTEEGRKKILDSYGKTEKDLANDVQLIQEWFKSQPHLPEKPSNERIEFFIITNKFSLEKTKNKLDMYYTIRSLIPSVYEINNPKSQQMKDNAKTAYVFYLPKLIEDVYQVVFFKLKSLIPNNFDANWWIASGVVNPPEVLMEENLLTLGAIIVYDNQHLRKEHILKMTPTYLRNLVNVLEKVFSSRVKAVHVINYPPIVDIVLKLFKPLLKEKLYNRIILHSSYNTLADHIPLDILPKDYGGHEKSVEELQEIWNTKLKSHQARFDELDKLRVNEKLRPTPMEDIDAFGLQGTFKKLSVD